MLNRDPFLSYPSFSVFFIFVVEIHNYNNVFPTTAAFLRRHDQKTDVTSEWIHVYCNSVQPTETCTRNLVQQFLVWAGQRI